MLAVVAQLGLFIYFGTLIGVLTKAPWVYPYSWHPICMGLYGFVATEGEFGLIISRSTNIDKNNGITDNP